VCFFFLWEVRQRICFGGGISLTYQKEKKTILLIGQNRGFRARRGKMGGREEKKTVMSGKPAVTQVKLFKPQGKGELRRQKNDVKGGVLVGEKKCRKKENGEPEESIR